jgi:RecJ-like exonuclease
MAPIGGPAGDNNPCMTCQGTGMVGSDKCRKCIGTGYRGGIEISETMLDVLDKLVDIKEKIDEIKTVVDAL